MRDNPILVILFAIVFAFVCMMILDIMTTKQKPAQDLTITLNKHGNIEFEAGKCWGVVNVKKKSVYQSCSDRSGAVNKGE